MTISSVLNQIFRPQAVLARRVAENPEAVITAGKALVNVINGSGHQIGFRGLAAHQAFRRMHEVGAGSDKVTDAQQALRDVRIIKHDLARQVHEARKDVSGQASWYADRLTQLRNLHQQARDVQHLRFDKAR